MCHTYAHMQFLVLTDDSKLVTSLISYVLSMEILFICFLSCLHIYLLYLSLCGLYHTHLFRDWDRYSRSICMCVFSQHYQYHLFVNC